MFYAHFVLAKKGPLARIWLAAHWDKKLTKAHVFETNIESSVEGILQPKVKMALRTSGHLLLGIVRIYSRKAKYLLADCNEAFIKIKMAFRPGVVDLPEAAREAAVSTITLPEVFHDFDNVPDIEMDIDEQVTLNQSRAEDITLKEDYGHLNLMTDDGFEEWHEPETAREATSIDESFENASLLLEEQAKETADETIQNNTSVASKPSVLMTSSLRDDGFGGTVGEGLLDGETGGLFEPAGLFDDAPLDTVALENPEHVEETVEKPVEEHNEDSNDIYDMGPASGGLPSPPSSPESGPTEKAPELDVSSLVNRENIDNLFDIKPLCSSVTPDAAASDVFSNVAEMPPPPDAYPLTDQTTLINNEDESFALAPLDTTIMQGTEKTVKAKRKRKLIVDEVKNISGEEMKSQLSDTADIVTTLDLAPPTKRLMHWKETGGVEKLFALPGTTILSNRLARLYQTHLTSKTVDNEDFGTGDDFHFDLDDIEQPRERDESEINTVPHKKPRRIDTNQMYSKERNQLDTLHLETSHPSFNSSDHPLQLTHPSLSVSNFLHQQMLSEQQQMINSVIQHQPPAHMIQHMLQTSVADINQLAHLPDMMHHTMVNRGTPLHSITSTIHNVPSVPSPVVSEAYNQRIIHPIIEHEHQNFLSGTMPDHLQQVSIDKQIFSHSSMVNQLNQLQDQLSQSTVTNIPSIENNPCNETENEIMQRMDDHMLQSPVTTTSMLQSPVTTTSMLQSPVTNTSMLQSPVTNTSMLQSPVTNTSMLQSPVTNTSMLQSPVTNTNMLQPPVTPTNMLQPPVTTTNMLQPPVTTTNMLQPSVTTISMQQLPVTTTSISQPPITTSGMLESPVDEDITQPCLNEDYMQVVHPNSLPNANALPIEETHNLQVSQLNSESTTIQNELKQIVNEEGSNMFDSINNNEIKPTENNQLPQNENSAIPRNEFMSDDDDDFGAPHSVGPALPEEQMADETYEQFEERILTKRTTHMLHMINSKLEQDGKVNFADIARNHKRKQVAQKFYTFLVLKKQQAIELEQNSSYGDLIITKGPKFNAVYNGN